MDIDLTDISALMSCHPQFTTPRSTVSVDAVSSHFFPIATEPRTLYITTAEHLASIRDTAPGTVFICIAGNDPMPDPAPVGLAAVLHGDVTPDEAYEMVMAHIFRTQRLFEAERRILDAFVDYRRLPVFLDLAAGALDSPFFFCDMDGNLIATSSEVPGNARWDAMRESRRFDLQECLRGPGTLGTSTDANGVSLMEFEDGDMVAFAEIGVERTPIGYVGSLGSFDWNDHVLSTFIRYVARIVSAQMSKSDYYRSGRHDLYESFFRTILKGSSNSEIVYARMKVLGITLKERLEALLVKTAGRTPFEKAEQLVTQREIEALLGDCHSLVNKGTLIFVLEQDEVALRSDRPELRELEAYLIRHGLVAGLSNPFDDISKLGIFCEQADKAVFYATAVRKSAKVLNRFKDYIIDYLLEYCAAGLDLKNLRHPAIDTLVAYDTKMKTDYLETLGVYLACVGNMAKTAQILGVHYNTVKYRMQAIEGIADISLKDSVTILTLSMAFRINEGLGQFFLENRA